MCGIFGCLLKDGNAAPIIHSALHRLEYRGYDSVGEATLHEGRIFIKKDAGKIDEVHKILNLDDLPGRIGIGHTRWATHGAPSKVNAHPHTDCKGQVAVVHNGIIENYAELKMELEAKGHVFRSKTDTEVISHLIEEGLQSGMGLVEAVREAVKRLEGSYAIAVISTVEPDKIVCARNESPLVLGISENGVFCASDIPAFLPHTNKIIVVNDGELVVLKDDGYEVSRISDAAPILREPEIVDWTPEMAEKQGFPHFMLKEIHEQPLCLRNTLRLQEQYLELMTKYYRAAYPALGMELPFGERATKKPLFPVLDKKLESFLSPFITENGEFNGKIVVGSPEPHGPFKTVARDGHYAAHLAFFLGQFVKNPEDFVVRLDVDIKAEKEEKNNLILVGGPGTNLITQEINCHLPIRFNMKRSRHGFLFGGLVSKKTGEVYTQDTVGIIAKIVNPWDKSKRIIVLAGNKAVGTKACVIALSNFWKEALKKYEGQKRFAAVIQGFDLDGDGKVDSIEILE